MRHLFITLILNLTFLGAFSQSKWAFETPDSKSGKFDYFVGEGTTRDDAYLDALEALASQRGLVNAEFTTEKKVQIVDNLRKSLFETTSEYSVGNKSLFLFKVREENDGNRYYILIGSPKPKYGNIQGGLVPTGNFVWRSAIAPGWGQFYNKETSKGLLFSLGTVAFIGGSIYAFDQAGKQADQARLALISGNLGQFNTFDQRETDWRTTGTVLGIGAVATWILNVIDATASKKHVYADSGNKKELHFFARGNSVGLNLRF